MTAPSRPIGYWLKRLDRSIEDGFERDLARWSLTRRHWQVLHTLATHPADQAAIRDALAPFWTDETITLDQVVNDLQIRHWAQRATEHLALTPEGETAHAEINAQIQASRARMMKDLTAQDYATVVRLLEAMTTNLTTRRSPPG